MGWDDVMPMRRRRVGISYRDGTTVQSSVWDEWMLACLQLNGFKRLLMVVSSKEVRGSG
ncbi:hypothetical protein [Candidatus Hodgkinia cicadicola]|uniref:hypothetical protein n=1 Tax=Candidatus Hodgkinia cicadicola TaxID=573658 RepID=UPI001788C214